MDQVTVPRELLRQAIEAMTGVAEWVELRPKTHPWDAFQRLDPAITALRNALEQPEQEPIGEIVEDCNGHPWKRIEYRYPSDIADLPIGVKVYAAPQAQQPAVEPVAWIYQNANTDNEYLAWKKGTGGRNWRPLFTSSSAQETVVGVDYRGMYLKVRDDLAAAQQRLDTCEALARSVMNDQVGRA